MSKDFNFLCRGRGSRALLKWFKHGVLIHDASYHVAVQLEGPEVGVPSSLLQDFLFYNFFPFLLTLLDNKGLLGLRKQWL